MANIITKEFIAICQKHNFDNDWSRQLHKLIVLNDGHLNSFIIRGHFDVSWAVCQRLCNDLVTADHAKLLPEEMKGDQLSIKYRNGGAHD